MSYPFVASPNVTHTNGRQIDVIVIHTMENDEMGTAAESCAQWFANPASRVSAHYCVDDNSIVQCVKEEDVAWHAPGANHNGIGVEHAGHAAQNPAQWADAYSAAMLAQSAKLVAAILDRYKIPTTWLMPGDLASGKRGITSHANVTKAFKIGSHWDPGDHFPVERYLAAVRAARGGSGGQAVAPDPPTLKRGDTGWQVTRLQRMLRQAGEFPPPAAIDGVFGDLTYTAVFTFQAKHHLAKDGIAGPLTWRTLAEVIQQQSVAPGPASTDAHNRQPAQV
jgi:N-acetyl-anhydromuramyl-L-alanine amidase AmpD